MEREARRQALRSLAATFDRIDTAVYDRFQKDPLEPIIGMGPRHARIAILGRDPGRHEVQYGCPFVGAGGQKIRRGLYQAVYGSPLPDFEASLEVGRHAFWVNTVPYKPIGNKPWPMRIQRAVRPLIADVLLNEWDGTHVLCFGNKAVEWFGLDDPATKSILSRHMEREDRYEVPVRALLTGPEGTTRSLTLHPLPHPSPLNRVWSSRFPGLLANCLHRLEFGPLEET